MMMMWCKYGMNDNRKFKCLNCKAPLNNNYHSSHFCSGYCKDAYIRRTT